VKRLFSALNAVIAISAGVIVLLGYFLDIPILHNLRSLLLQWAFILAGLAVLIGTWNLFSVHLQKVRERKSGFINNMVLLFFLLLTMTIGLTPALRPLQYLVFNGILVPAEISLLAVLAVTLIYGSLRLMRIRNNLASVMFLFSALLILLGTGPFPFIGQMPVISDWIRPFISNNLVSGGARGILIGISLGTLTTGLRILFGVDRPYEGNQ